MLWTQRLAFVVFSGLNVESYFCNICLLPSGPRLNCFNVEHVSLWKQLGRMEITATFLP